MLQRTMISSALLLALSLAAFGARFTSAFDTVESTVQDLQAALPPKLDKAQKKAAKTYRSTLKKLRKDTTSLKSEIKLGKGLVGKLLKLGDEDVGAALEASVERLRHEVQNALELAQQKLGSVPTKITPAKVQKQLDAGFAAMEAAAAQGKLKKRIALFGKAEARARKAEKLIGKLTGGGGGGGGDCEGQDIGPGDTLDITRNGADFGAAKYSVETVTDDFGTKTVVTLTNCTSNRKLVLTFPSPLFPGSYSGGSIFPENKVGFFAGPAQDGGFGISNFGGSATVMNVATRLQLTFSWSTGDAGSDFDGLYEGMIDIPAN